MLGTSMLGLVAGDVVAAGYIRGTLVRARVPDGAGASRRDVDASTDAPARHADDGDRGRAGSVRDSMQEIRDGGAG